MSQLPIVQKFTRVGDALVPTDLVRPDGEVIPTRTEVEAAAAVEAAEIALAEGKVLVGAATGKASATTVAAGRVVMGDATGKAVAQAITGTVSLSAAGATALALAEGQVYVGNASNQAAAAAMAAGRLLVGDAAGKAAAVDVTGDVTITSAGVTAIGAAKVTAAMLADGAGLAALLTAGLGASVLVDHADVSPVEVLAADGVNDRAVIVVAVCTETLAGDDEPTFDFGWAADPDGLLDQLVLAGATAGDIFVGAGVVPATNAIIATLTDGGTPTNDAGAFSFTVLALPTTP